MTLPQRPHKPWEIGPRVFRRGRYWWVDLRYASGGRVVMRNPRDPSWPDGGERTELREVAERWKWAYVDLGHELHRERVLGPSRPKLLDEAIAEYTTERANMVAPATAVNDRTALGHLTADWGRTPVHLVSPQRTLARLLARGFKPATVQTYSAFLSGFWKWLGLPYEVELPKWQRSEPRVWTDAEIAKIRDFADDMLLAIDCGLYMGLRYGEIMGLEWADVELSTWTVRVRRQKNGLPLKSRRRRTAVILPGWEHPPGEGLVTSADERGMRWLLQRIGMWEKGVGWHSLRHAYARKFLEAKPDMRLLQASLGHSSVTVTEAAYNWLLPDKAAELSVRAIHQM